MYGFDRSTERWAERLKIHASFSARDTEKIPKRLKIPRAYSEVFNDLRNWLFPINFDDLPDADDQLWVWDRIHRHYFFGVAFYLRKRAKAYEDREQSRLRGGHMRTRRLNFRQQIRECRQFLAERATWYASPDGRSHALGSWNGRHRPPFEARGG